MKRSINSIYLMRIAAFVLWAFSASCGISVHPSGNDLSKKVVGGDNSKQKDESRTYTGQYVNRWFGYSLTIPAGLVGTNSPPPAPDSGLVVRLDNSAKRSIRIFAEYPPDSDNLKDTVEWYLGVYEDRKLTRVEQRDELLGGMPAVRILLNGRSDNDGLVLIRIISFRDCGDDPPIIYSLELETNELSRFHDEAMFERFIENWKMLDKCSE